MYRARKRWGGGGRGWGTDINELNGAIAGKGAADIGPLRCCIQLCYPHLLQLCEALSYERMRPKATGCTQLCYLHLLRLYEALSYECMRPSATCWTLLPAPVNERINVLITFYEGMNV